ncbi:hypothetical protein [Brenneria sp. L3-3Z]|nr:hypothetical protein [Brenneria sp. L3-3Z]MDX5629906.1 hypothetical protein [Brenneria sp. L3-3Z]
MMSQLQSLWRKKPIMRWAEKFPRQQKIFRKFLTSHRDGPYWGDGHEIARHKKPNIDKNNASSDSSLNVSAIKLLSYCMVQRGND